MGAIDDAALKLKGKAKQVQGDINQERGKGIKGGLQKLQGKIEEAVADAKLKMRAEATKEENKDQAANEDI